MEDLNKISSTRVGDNIHFYVNGQENKGTVVKMDTSYVTVLKDDGNFQDIKAYSPRFLAKSWQDLPRELKVVLEDTAKDATTGEERIFDGKEDNALPAASEQSHQAASRAAKKPESGQGTHNSDLANAEGIKTQKQIPIRPDYSTADSQNTGAPAGEKIDDKILTDMQSDWQADELNTGGVRPPKGGKSPKDMETKKSNVEQGHLGSAGRASHVVETNIDFDAPDDYEGQTEDEKKEQFKHEDKKPQTTNKTLQEQLWEDWLNKESSGNMGDGGSPAQTSITTGTTGMYNAVYGKDGRIKGQEKDKDEEETEKDKEEKEKERKG